MVRVYKIRAAQNLNKRSSFSVLPEHRTEKIRTSYRVSTFLQVRTACKVLSNIQS